MTTLSDHELDRYAELALRVGVNLQPGQRLLIRAELEAAPLVKRLAEHAYRMGARLVETIYLDPALIVARYREAPRDSFEEVSRWRVEAGLEYAREGHALLSIASTDPDLLQGIDPQLIATVQRTEARVGEPYMQLVSAKAINWSIVAYPGAAWAAKVFPDAPADEQQERLFAAIARAVRLDRPDPVAAWQQHVERLAERTAFLNTRQYDALHFRGPGTDLTVGLPYNHRWLGGATPSTNGITNVPNMPTEEVFTAPHRRRVNGTVRSTMPLNYGGNIVEGFSLTFEDGRVVDLSAARGESLLRALVETDEGAARLGEVALVPHNSPIAQSGVLFYNTLFDENAASHVALGRAYRGCIEGCDAIPEEDFNALGGNSSLTHVDFMIGSAEIDVDAITGDGEVEPLMRSGEWTR